MKMTQAYPHIKDNLEAVRARIASALSHAGRSQQETQLIAVSKKFSEELIREAYLSGQKHFGENYVQEATNKIDKLSDLPLEWHFIGPIQSNKTGQIATKFDWVHSVDRLKIAQRLSQARSASGSSLKICLQVNISEEESKQGCSVADLVELAQSVERLPNLEFRGLMTMPRAKASNQDIVDTFRRLAELKNALNQEGLKLDVLSMGMSDDLEIGIQEGATFVRVGRGIFGNR
jgi:pyridoxal phosphate enzyme (YggS family)